MPTRVGSAIAADAKQLSQFCRLNVCSMVGGMDFDKQRQQIEKRNVVFWYARAFIGFFKAGLCLLRSSETSDR